ncbi:hypothetical protein [Tuwongella immobilis]|uniref:Uncharacterized protein n=1 Tax=Tuwongella immobilis TaxID=692036 RepID=A0A6C2YVS4_9BACT|nr:hypothetical protein [Tuwongella immobilis]VIP05616.1 Uncharacterized protein OS=Planctomyces brasiliensis (strain ATCC 49424 / DSM 5305 / JCM 21570 / NBRC 103401 / IFAM 1448) GN=Plabr_2903 PE=4 SV=1 [Tuwongella immobilis]VTS08588.1 Uncharacterized protein OS=Planctomyces brasiliensis (strain ATCC 49424 / DSM 5305 / JCM 21570 / NBRC 103401 / IFAM 1448) GN=Plabr_2903 PE=4 SV=1 [Tuwongella immobilis]
MRFVMLAVVLLGGLVPAVSAQSPAEMLTLAPPPYNTITLINVQSILATPRARAEKWAERDHTEYLAGAIPFHASAQRILATSEFRQGVRDGSNTGVLLIPLQKPMDMNAVAKIVNGQTVTIAETTGVRTQRGLYLLPLGEQLLGAMRTDHRPEIARWMENVRERKLVNPPRYLSGVLNPPGNQQILIAVDTAELFDPTDVEVAVSVSPIVEKDRESARRVTRYLSGLRGVRLVMNMVDSNIRLNVILDGRDPPNVKADLLKSVIVELVERSGAGLTDLRSSTEAIDGVRFSLTFNITDDELAHITALVLPPVPPTSAYSTLSVRTGEVRADVTKRYIDAANQIITDLKKRYDRARDYNQTALWHDTAAKRLEALSAINVEPKAVEHVMTMANMLLDVGDSLRGVPVQIAKLESNAYAWGFGGGVGHIRQPYIGWRRVYTPGFIDTNIGQIRQQQNQAIAADKANRDRLWAKIDSERSQLTQIKWQQQR